MVRLSGIGGGGLRGGIVGVHVVSEGNVFGDGHGLVGFCGDRFIGGGGGEGSELPPKGAFCGHHVMADV